MRGPRLTTLVSTAATGCDACLGVRWLLAVCGGRFMPSPCVSILLLLGYAFSISLI